MPTKPNKWLTPSFDDYIDYEVKHAKNETERNAALFLKTFALMVRTRSDLCEEYNKYKKGTEERAKISVTK